MTQKERHLFSALNVERGQGPALVAFRASTKAGFHCCVDPDWAAIEAYATTSVRKFMLVEHLRVTANEIAKLEVSK